MIVFDIEIKKAIQSRNEPRLEGIEYCEGWRDFEGMGIACVCTFDTDTHLSRAFLDGQRQDLHDYLAIEGATGGFNTRRFDIPLLRQAWGIEVAAAQHYDALEKVWLACGLDPDKFSPGTHGGWGLDAIMQATFGLAKSASGAQAPIWWQQGKRGEVIDYCLRDVWLEAKLIVHMLNGGAVRATGKEPLQFTPTMAPT